MSRDISIHTDMSLLVKLTYIGKLQNLNVELIVNVLFYFEGA